MTVPSSPERTPYPRSCERCRHEMTWGQVQRDTGLRINGLCLRGHKHWPDGCGHYAERGK